jgi:NHLM bacteriocin system ABC transporter peptidase/ATP-binding protein
MTDTPVNDTATTEALPPGSKSAPTPGKHIQTPTVLQMEAVECGAAALGIVLAYYEKYIPLEELRIQCGVTRDGSKASNVLKAARQYGLEAKGFKKEIYEVWDLELPAIVFWNFNHFLVLEGFSGNTIYLNDPAGGPRRVRFEEFDQSFTGVILTFKPTADFVKSGQRSNLLKSLIPRLKGSQRPLFFVILVSLFLLIPGFVFPAFLRLFIDNVLIKGESAWAAGLLVGLVLLVILNAALTGLQQTALARLQTKLSLTTSSQFFWHVLRLPVEFFTQRYGGEIGTRIEINDRVAQLLSGELATNLLNALLIIFYVVIMLQYDVILTIIGVAIALLNLVALRFIYRARADANQKLLADRGSTVGVALSGITAIETLKSAGNESDFFSRWAGFQAKSSNSEQQLAFLSQMLSAVPPLLTSLNTTTILILGGLRVMDGIISIGTLVAFQSLMTSFLAPVNEMVNLGGRLQEAEGDMKRLDDVLHYAADPRVDRPVTPPRPLPSKLSGHIEIRNLTFGYNRLDPPLVDNFSLTLLPSQRVALVGGSGSGKSTVAKLVSGVYESWSGEILFDGLPRDQIPRRVLSNSLAVVDQDIFMLEGSIRQNITMWDPTISEADVLRATKDACIHDDIASKPGGYDHIVQEGGRNFSGGQRQRLEIVRALVNNPTMVILDEATSALDPIVEKQIMDNVRQRGCTCLIVAHRLSTIRDCDQIIVLERGKVVQHGTHDELKNVRGAYANLINAEVANAEEQKPIMQRLFDKLL